MARQCIATMERTEQAARSGIARRSGLQVVLAITETIREMGAVPSGHLYAPLTGKLTLEQYQRIIGVIKRAGLVRVAPSGLITWIGPAGGQHA